MSSAVKKAVGFLKENSMDPDQYDIENGTQMFIEEMERGLKGEKSSLYMLPTYVSAEGDIPAGEKVIVLDAGGTNFRTAAVRFDGEGNPVIENFRKFPMPGTGETENIGREEFFDTIASCMEDIAGESSRIGFCFSYPTEMMPGGDGRLITFTKEVKARGVEGAMIGENLLEALRRRGVYQKKEIIILNDTTAVLLAGRIGNTGKSFDSHIGFILGTGTNCSYIEDSTRITKIRETGKKERQIVNIESGKFSLFDGGTVDREFIASTDKPEESKLEKMTSGAYQGPLALAALKKAARSGIFSKKFTEGIAGLDTLDTRIMDEFLHTPFKTENSIAGMCGTEEDRTAAYVIMDRLIERAAKLAATQMAAVVLKTGRGTDPARPVCITADGTTFYKTKNLKFRTEYYLKLFLEEKYGRFTEFVKRDEAPLIGAAAAALLN